MTSVAPGADGSNGGGDPPRDNKKKPTEKMDRVEADNSGNDTRKKGKGALASMSDASPSSGTGLSSRGLSSKGLTEPTTTPATTNPVVASPGPSSPPPSDMSIPNLLSEVTETLQNQSLRSTPSSAASGSGTPNADTGKRKLDALGNEQQGLSSDPKGQGTDAPREAPAHRQRSESSKLSMEPPPPRRRRGRGRGRPKTRGRGNRGGESSSSRKLRSSGSTEEEDPSPEDDDKNKPLGFLPLDKTNKMPPKRRDSDEDDEAGAAGQPISP